MKRILKWNVRGAVLVALVFLGGCECEPAKEVAQESRELAPHPSSISIRNKAKTVIIPDLVIPGDSLEMAYWEIQKRGNEEDFTLSFVVRTPRRPVREYAPPNSTDPLELGDVSFLDALEGLCLHYNANFRFDEFAITVTPFQIDA